MRAIDFSHKNIPNESFWKFFLHCRIPSPKEGKPLPVGVAIIRALKQKVLEFKEKNPDRLTIMLETNVIGLVTWNDYITGVRYQSKDGPLGIYYFVFIL